MFDVGQTIDGQYLIERRLEGGMGVVYIAADTVTGKRYALKGLKLDESLSEEQRALRLARFEREARAWINLDHHPHIVQALAYIKREPLLLLEWVDGPSLDTVLEKAGRLSRRQAAGWARQVCSAMQYVHTKPLPGGQAGVLHRDLKPANLLVKVEGPGSTAEGGEGRGESRRPHAPQHSTLNPQLKVSDFGLVKVHDERSLSSTGHFLGTLSYSSPEQLQNAKYVDHRTDIFSFGIVLYEMLAGTHPFPAESISEAIQAIGHRQPCWDNLPGALAPLVRRCLEKSPARRYQSFAEVGAALAEVESRPDLDRDELACPTCGFLSGPAQTMSDICAVCGSRALGTEGETTEREREIAATVIYRQSGPNPSRQSPAGNVQRCQCGTVWPAESSFCHTCGRPRPMIECPCGHSLPAGTTYCTRCGRRLG